MEKSMAKAQTEQAGEFLSQAVQTLSDYLNETTLSSLETEEPGRSAYYREVLSNLRKLSVYCEEGLAACRIMLQQEPFQDTAAEKTLYQIYHRCIEEFFTPKKDTWYEDSRAAYTGRHAIRFHEPAPASLKNLMASLESGYQSMREELEYYGVDDRMKMVQSR
ncbi:YpuI family protein [Bacillus swezeyi]|uniref:YpuI family protein n=1 Tax=Bacillus swezeyi TaxID=1925020 RepID=UPI0039C5C041